MRRAPSCYGVVALLGCPILYFLLARFVPELDFLNRMAVTFGILILVAFVLRAVAPRKEAFVQQSPEFPTAAELESQLAEALKDESLTEEQRKQLTARSERQMTTERWNDFLKGSKGAVVFGIIVVILTILLYIKYWDSDLTLF